MTARTCPTCNGSGEVPARDRQGQPIRDRETNARVTETCQQCNGDGEVTA